jgi:hypothetical protein
MPDEPSNGSSEIAALAQQVETARGKLPLQLDPALLEVLSEREITAERELAEWIRAQRRKQRRREIEAELAAEQRDRKSAAALRRSEEADDRWHRRALAARRRASSEDARLAQLYRRAEWSSRALIAVVVLGMVWAGVNVQHNLVPSGDMSDPLYWLSYGIEAMISIPIITIMVAATTAARWGRELARGKVLFFEAALLGTTVALNTGPHLAAGDLGRAAEYAIAPVMVGVVIWLHAWVAARYAVLIDGAPVIERDRRMIRIDAQPAPGLPEAGEYRPLDAVTNSGESGTRPGAQPEGFTRPTAAAMPAPVGDAHGKSATNGHPARSPINGHPVPIDRTPLAGSIPEDGEVGENTAIPRSADERPTNGHAVATGPNGAAFPRPRNGNTHHLPVNGHVLPIDGETSRTSTNGNAHPRINGHTLRPATNGRTATTPTDGAEQHSGGDANTIPGTDGGFRTTGDARANGHTAPLVAENPTDTPAINESPDESVVSGRESTTSSTHPVSTVPQLHVEARNDDHPARPLESETAQPSSNDFGRGTPDRAETPASSDPEPQHTPSAAQQISLSDLNDGFEFGPTRANGAVSPHAHADRGERAIDRAHRVDNPARHPGSTEPTRTPPHATSDPAAQAHPNATAPRPAKRGKSVSAERNDHSADAESEQLALEETPEPSRPRVEPMPILDTHDDEDDEIATEPEEADTDDDEISAIARAIIDRRLSDLPIEEIREILTLADQGGSTFAIANELGVSHSAITRVLDSAIKVHRPYATIG